MAAILNSAIMNLAILDSAILVFPLKLTHTCQDWFPPFAQKKTSLIHSDSTLMMAAILNSAILDSDTAILDVRQPCYLLWDSLRNTLNSTLTLIQAILNSAIWIQPLSSWIQTPCYLLSDSLKNTLMPLSLWLKPIQSDSNSFILTSWWCQPSWNLPSWIQPFWTKKKLHSFILTQLYDGSHLEYCHLGFSHF